MTGVRLYAHRGASAELPENTLEAFERALELGADAIETDVHLTKDGHVVVFHDESAERTCGRLERVARATLDEVRAWDAGFGFVAKSGERPFVGRGFRAPTFADVLAAIRDVPINVDAKHIEVVPALLEVIRRARAQDRVLVASFDDRTLRLVRRLGYEGMTGLARNEVARLLCLPAHVNRLVPLGGRAAQLPDRLRGLDLGTRRVVERCHALGLVVHYWTIDDPDRARALVAAGADGIMTNDPARLAPALA